MGRNEDEVCELIEVAETEEFHELRNNHKSGIAFVPTAYSDNGQKVVTSEAGQFAKWIRRNHGEIDVAYPGDTPKLALRSDDFWLPFVYLASDVSLQLYLNIVANYIYDRLKGMLKGEKRKVHVKALIIDEQTGVFKSFEYDGDVEGIKRIDFNKFWD